MHVLLELGEFVVEGGRDELELILFHDCKLLEVLVLLDLLLDVSHIGQHVM